MPVPCNRCNQPLPKWGLATGEAVLCPECGAASLVRVFPALFYAPSGPAAAEAAEEGEATCFDHPAKRAVAACSRCGRFVCQLCEVEFKGAVWCPSCFTAGETQAKTPGFGNSRTLYDSTALIVAAAPLLVWPFTAISAPIALFLAVRYWNRPLSLVRRWRWRSALAAAVALCEIGAWIWGITYLLLKGRS
ncbi:MAG TPA: hypothetical protein VMG35_23070 [Bryobacteraceae bacterium]|nr:hypothetical protein [Bryobacteraceae bacterium]